MGISDTTESSSMSIWTDVKDMLSSMSCISINDKTPVVDWNEAFWNDAHEQFCKHLPISTYVSLTRSFPFEHNKGQNCMMIRTTGQFQFLHKFKMENCKFNLKLKHFGYGKELFLCTADSQWKPTTPIPLRDVEYIILELHTINSDNNTGSIFSISMGKVNDPAVCADMYKMSMKASVDDDYCLYLPGHPAPYIGKSKVCDEKDKDMK